jgi:Domain of unknown function (DUF6907)
MTVTRDAVPAEGLPPVGTNAGHPLDEHPLPFWLTAPCPPWCQGNPHRDSHDGLMRTHESRAHDVILSMVKAGEVADSHDPSVGGYVPQVIDVEMRQGYRDAEPHFRFCFACNSEPSLTLAEAGQFIDILQHLTLHASDLMDGDDMSPQTTARPFWLTGPCPAWCIEKHEEAEFPCDRRHAGEYHAVALSMEDPFDAGWPAKPGEAKASRWVPRELEAALEQDWREAEPHIVIRASDTEYYELTIAEADELAADMAHLLGCVQ